MSSKASLSPNYCSCTVLRARNLYDKGKSEGINAFCTIAMGKEKFGTEVCEKTLAPEWHEQCDMPIVDDATVKLTVYHKHKSSLTKEDFIGRAFVSLRNLQDYDRVHTSWYKLTNRDGKIDKERGEIEVQLQFYSKNDTTGSVLDLATKKKHSSFKDIKHSLSKLNIAKHRKDKYAEGNQLAEQRRKLGGDFLEEDSSETTSFTGSHVSLNSMAYNNNGDQQKKRSYTTNLGTPQSTHRSITSDYETSSILDSASMYGTDEVSNSSTTNPFQQDMNADEQIDNKKKKKKAPKAASQSPKTQERTRSSTVVADTSNAMDHETDRSFGLSTIRETHDQPTDDEIDFGGYFDRIQKTKRLAPTIPANSQSDDVQTPTISTYTTKPNEGGDSTDDDVDELLGKLERMSSMRSSKRRVIPRIEIADESPSETDNKFFGGRRRSQTSALPDIVVDPKLTKSPKGSKKIETKPLNVLGYTNVQTTMINSNIRQELQSLNQEELLQVIAYQTDVIKKRDTRLKDLEQYTDSLLVKIVEQCPTILQSEDLQFHNN